MRYIHYKESHIVPHVAVHGRGNKRSVLVLSNFPSAGTPLELKADISLEIVLKFLQSSIRYRFAEINLVTSSQLDVDGLLSIWTILNPEKSEKFQTVLRAAVYTSSFHQKTTEEGMRLSTVIESLYPHDSTIGSLEQIFYEIEEIIVNQEKHNDIWKTVKEQIEKDTNLIKGKGYVNEFPHIDLAVFDLPQDVNLISLFSSTKYHKILVILPGQRYYLRYKYETWVELVSYTPPPRIDLTELAGHLRTKENHNKGYWQWNKVTTPRPSLSFVTDNDMLADSHISPQALLANLIRYLEDSTTRQDLIWTPNDWKPYCAE